MSNKGLDISCAISEIVKDLHKIVTNNINVKLVEGHFLLILS